MSAPTLDVVTIQSFADAKDAYRQKDLRQALYDEGEVIMADVLVNLHGDEHRRRRRVENRSFRRDTFDLYERHLFPAVTEQTIAPYLAAGRVDLVHLGHELMLNLAALTAGVDRPQGTAEETARLFDYTMLFIEGATLAHSTKDKDEQRACIFEGLVQWDEEFLKPSVARRREALARAEAGEIPESEVPKDVLTTLLRGEGELDLPHEVIRREVAFLLLAGAHTSATAFVRAIDHILSWVEAHPDDAPKVLEDPLFVQRCIHETVRLNPSSPVGATLGAERGDPQVRGPDPQGRQARDRPRGGQPRSGGVRADGGGVRPLPGAAARRRAVRAELRRRHARLHRPGPGRRAWCPPGTSTPTPTCSGW